MEDETLELVYFEAPLFVSDAEFVTLATEAARAAGVDPERLMFESKGMTRITGKGTRIVYSVPLRKRGGV